MFFYYIFSLFFFFTDNSELHAQVPASSSCSAGQWYLYDEVEFFQHVRVRRDCLHRSHGIPKRTGKDVPEDAKYSTILNIWCVSRHLS